MENEEAIKVGQVFQDRLIKCVYDDGGRITVVKGRLVGVWDSFIEIESLKNRYLIRVSDIRKIQAALRHGGRR